MKTFLISIFILSSLTVFCQDKTGNKGNWNIGIAFSPDVYFSQASIFTGPDIGYHLDPSGFSFTSGFMGTYSIEQKVAIGSGINYSQKAISGTFYCTLCDVFGVQKPEPISLQFIEIPLFVRYNILDRKFGVFADGGLTSGYMINPIDKKYEGTLSFNKFQLSGKISLGINLDLGQNIHLFLLSAYRHPFTGISENSNNNFSYVSIETGIAYRFRRNKSLE